MVKLLLCFNLSRLGGDWTVNGIEFGWEGAGKMFEPRYYEAGVKGSWQGKAKQSVLRIAAAFAFLRFHTPDSSNNGHGPPVTLRGPRGSPSGNLAHQIRELLLNTRKQDRDMRVPWVLNVFDRVPPEARDSGRVIYTALDVGLIESSSDGEEIIAYNKTHMPIAGIRFECDGKLMSRNELGQFLHGSGLSAEVPTASERHHEAEMKPWTSRGVRIGLDYGVLVRTTKGVDFSKEFFEALGLEARKSAADNDASLFEPGFHVVCARHPPSTSRCLDH